MTYVFLAGLSVLLLFHLSQRVGHLRRSVLQYRSFRHGDDDEWECTAERRIRLRR